MSFRNMRNAVGVSVLAAGMAASAFGQFTPIEFYREQAAPNKGDMAMHHNYNLDFTTNSANPAFNYFTFPNPKAPGFIVKYQSHTFVSAFAPGACFEIVSSGPNGADVILSVFNQAGAWTWLADDNAGNRQFRARIFLPGFAQYAVRISEYSPNNPNNQTHINVRKYNLDGGAAITATSCRLNGVPFWQPNLNGGNPYNPL